MISMLAWPLAWAHDWKSNQSCEMPLQWPLLLQYGKILCAAMSWHFPSREFVWLLLQNNNFLTIVMMLHCLSSIDLLVCMASTDTYCDIRMTLRFQSVHDKMAVGGHGVQARLCQHVRSNGLQVRANTSQTHRWRMFAATAQRWPWIT